LLIDISSYEGKHTNHNNTISEIINNDKAKIHANVENILIFCGFSDAPDICGKLSDIITVCGFTGGVGAIECES
jgi:hypothetical protein